MYVLIDLARMSVAGKNANLFALNDYSIIELGMKAACEMFRADDSRALSNYGTGDLERLYQNSTGEKFPTANRNALVQCLIEAIELMPETQIDPIEADLQADYADRKCLGPCRYVYGSKIPSVQNDGLYDSPILTAALPSERVSKAVAGEYPALYKKQSSTPAAQAAQGSDIAARGTVPAQAPENAPRKGTSKQIIWQEADAAWEAIGSTKDLKQVHEMRKNLMAKLESDYGIKRTSASSELGQWQKSRII